MWFGWSIFDRTESTPFRVFTSQKLGTIAIEPVEGAGALYCMDKDLSVRKVFGNVWSPLRTPLDPGHGRDHEAAISRQPEVRSALK